MAAPSALTLSSSAPADEATGVALDAAVVLTFNNKLSGYAYTLVDVTGDVAASTAALDSTGKILTITPAEDLTADTTYILALSLAMDVFGQTLTGTAINFTTVSS